MRSMRRARQNVALALIPTLLAACASDPGGRCLTDPVITLTADEEVILETFAPRVLESITVHNAGLFAVCAEPRRI